MLTTRQPISKSHTDLIIRRLGPDDVEALERLAQRDSATVPVGTVYAAVAPGGSFLAAISLESRALIADPFRPTAQAAKLLRVWARQLRGESRRGARRARALIAPSAAAPAPATVPSDTPACAGRC